MKQNIKTIIHYLPLSLFICCFLTNTNAQNIAIEQDAACINCPDLTADPSAALEVRASDKGVLVPRVDSTSVISNPAEGLVIYDNSANDFKFYDGAKWQNMGLKHIAFPGNNTFVGVNTGVNNTGGGNTAHGYYALSSNTTGNKNTAIGINALLNNTTGFTTIAIGPSTLYSNTIGWSNIAIGFQTMYSNISGDNNAAVGHNALYSNTTGYWNTAVGNGALYGNTTGGSNVALGRRALNANTTGGNNTALGGSALQLNTTGIHNTAAGYGALPNNTTGSFNVASGRFSLRFNTTGNFNTALGHEAMNNNTIGTHNTAIGYRTFYNDSTHVNSTAVGYNAQPTGSNQVRLGNSSITSIGGYANWSNISDARFKKQVQDNVPGLAFISLLNPVTYQMDMDAIARHHNTSDDLRLKDSEQAKATIRYTGFLAQEVEKAAESLGYDFSGVDAPQHERDNYSLRYAEFVVPLVKAVQELEAENKALRAQHADMEARLGKIEALLRQRAE